MVSAAATTPPPRPLPADMAAAGAAAPVAAAVQAAGGGGDGDATFRDGGRTVTVNADLLERIVKNVHILAEMVRRQNERANMCRGCKGEPDYLAEYAGEYVRQGEKARVCERCLEDAVSHEYGVHVHVWKHNLSKLTCLRCGDDVTGRGWCVCPRNAALARKDAATSTASRTTEGDAK